MHPHVPSMQPCWSRCDAPEESLGEDEQEVEGESLGSDDDLDESDEGDEGDEGDEAGVTVAAEAAAPAVAPAVTACAEVDLVPDHAAEQADDDDDDDELLAMLD